MRPGGGEPDTPGWTDARRPEPLPGAEQRGGRRCRARAAERGRRPRPTPAPSPAAATRCWRRGGRANRTSSPRGRRLGAHEVVINAPQHATALAELSDEQVAAAVETWRERMRAHSDAPYVQLIVNEGGARGRLARARPRPALRVALRAGRGRARARARRRLPRTDGGRRAARRRPGRGGAAQGAPGGDRRRGGADLPLGLALALRDAHRARAPSRRASPRTRRGRRCWGRAMRLLAERLGGPPDLNLWVRTAPRGEPRASTGTSTSRRASAVKAGFELGTGVDINTYPPGAGRRRPARGSAGE